MLDSFQATLAAIAHGDLTAEDVVEHCLERIDRVDGRLSAWGTVDREGALSAARTCRPDRGPDGTGPLFGMPVGIKENIAVKGLPFTAGSPAYAGSTARADSPLVSRLRAAGAVILGTLRMHELAIGDAVVDGPWRTSRHPWNDAYAPGGSSCGSAVAAATSMCAGAVGGDTGGSVRNPAASCGVVGYKPTTGIVDPAGVIPLCWSLDTVGFLGRDVATITAFAEAVLGVVASELGNDARIGLVVEDTGDLTDAIRQMLDDVRAALSAAPRVRLRLIPKLELATASSVWQARLKEFAFAHHVRYSETPELFGPSVRVLLDDAIEIDRGRYVSSFAEADVLADEVDRLLDGNDVIVTPANPRPALTWEQWTRSGKEDSEVFDWYRYQWPFNVTGHPAVAVPWSVDPSTNLPRAVQIVGRRHADDVLVKVSSIVESLAPGVGQPPLE
jgi:aspartyl-tRNA(Asn)/glutamyl-tRNA(Gln) amidotransferase subunit A